MSATPKNSKVYVLVKALPQQSKLHGETVCCAGITRSGEWKRLFPVRFRHLKGESSFGRWDEVDFKYDLPTHDSRNESCKVYEDSIRIVGRLPTSERSAFLEPLIQPSIQAAAEKHHSLALIRPKNTRFIFRKKSPKDIAEERESFSIAAKQISFIDEELSALEPTPYEFRFRFEDDTRHDFRNGDWEPHAMFYNGKRNGESDQEILDRMDHIFNEEYPRKGMLFAVGNMAKRPQTWQLLGVLRVDPTRQLGLPF